MISPLYFVWVLPVAIMLGVAYALLMMAISVPVIFSFAAVWLWQKAASAVRPTA